jgi:nucleoside-diphosphate-sugar epimerase
VVARLSSLAEVDRVVGVDRRRMPVTGPKLEVHALDLAGEGAAEELAALAKSAGAVFHLAWDRPGTRNLVLLANVLDAATAIEPAQFVHMSSATVYGAWHDNPVPLTEEAPVRPNPGFAYATEKRAAEAMVERWQSDRPETLVAVLRPACTLGSGGQPLPLAWTLRRHSAAPVGEEHLVQFVHADDLASAAVHAFEVGLHGVYNVAADGGLPERDAAALLGRARSLRLPATSSKAALGAGGRPAGPGARPYARHTWVVSPDKLRRTGWAAGYTSEEALVVTDRHGHWDDLPQAHRVSVTLGATAAAMVAAAAGGAAGWNWWKRRR